LIIDISNEKGLNILEGKYELGSILFPEAIFITNATKGIIEVVNIDNLIRPTRTQKIFPIIKNALYKALNWA
jgi:branched-subunit amino acid aminotransferase/4-amino-4-deoxychorismate lyase